jgi:AcrR family transcriptional regulator
LAEIGRLTTVEQIATHAEVSPTTIYKYFENKEQLFGVALNVAWVDFLIWTNSQKVLGEDLRGLWIQGANFCGHVKRTPSLQICSKNL